MKNLLVALLIALGILLTPGCGTKVGTGAVNVSFSNATGALFSQGFSAVSLHERLGIELFEGGPYLGVDPTIYRMKLVAMYMVEDIDANLDNVGAITRIWTSNKCDADLTQCGIGPSAGAYIVDYFDFAAGTAAVNETLNSYKRDAQEANINAGTYRYIRLDFQGATGGSDPTAPNLEFGTSSANAVRAQQGAINVELPSPLVLADGENFTVDLAYNLENRFYASGNVGSPPAEVNGADKWTCNGTTAVPCIVEAVFSPTIIKN